MSASSAATATRVLAILADVVEEFSGLHFEPDAKSGFAERVSARAADSGFESLLDYYYYLRYDPQGADELSKLVDDLVVGETYFFRELEPLRVAVEHFILPRVEKGLRPRVWSAACATGEEPVTLAMLLAQAGVLHRVELVASDISERALARARTGRWSRRALREVPSPALVSRWMSEEPDGTPRVQPHIVSAIDFRRVNLVSSKEVAAIGACDVIFARNVLIYFTDATATKVVENLTNNLDTDGALFVGISESLMRLGTGLECEEHDRVFFYRKPRS